MLSASIIAAWLEICISEYHHSTSTELDKMRIDHLQNWAGAQNNPERIDHQIFHTLPLQLIPLYMVVQLEAFKLHVPLESRYIIPIYVHAFVSLKVAVADFECLGGIIILWPSLHDTQWITGSHISIDLFKLLPGKLLPNQDKFRCI
jgi:hypothetical protein